MKSKATVHVKRMMPTYSRLRGIAWRSLKLAEQNIKGRESNCVISMLFCAFSLEAYLNHIGAKHFNRWEVMKEKLSPQDKLILITDEIGVNVDFSRRPFQTFKKVFKFRNWMVHAKTEEIEFKGELILDEDEKPPKPLAEWEKWVKLSTAQRFDEDSKAIIKLLHTEAILDGEPAPQVVKSIGDMALLFAVQSK